MLKCATTLQVLIVIKLPVPSACSYILKGKFHILIFDSEIDNFFSYCLIPFKLFVFQNKSAFLCGVMKTYRQREKQGTKVSDTNKGPDEAKIKVRTDGSFKNHSKTDFMLRSTLLNNECFLGPKKCNNSVSAPPLFLFSLIFF